MKSPDKIIVVDRSRPLRTHLLTLLADLGEDDWARLTAAPGWVRSSHWSGGGNRL